MAGRIEVDRVEKGFGGPPVLQNITLEIEPGEIVALLGPSGCGKTTLLRTIAGLERVDSGAIRLNDTTVSGPGVHVPPESRRIGMVFQDWALFPHLSVGGNVAYGLPRAERRGDRVAEALGLVGLEGLADRSPATLSGGQQQRVALARALAPQPQALLLDEPFSNLDTSLRIQIRTDVHRLLSELGITTIFVTHDQEEAFVLGSRVAVMNGGVIEQYATPAEIYEAPATRWIAEFVGEANLISGLANGRSAVTGVGEIPLTEDHRGNVQVVVRPELLEAVADPDGTAQVDLVEYYGHDHVLIVVTPDGERIRCRRTGAPQVGRGQSVTIKPVASAARAFSID